MRGLRSSRELIHSRKGNVRVAATASMATAHAPEQHASSAHWVKEPVARERGFRETYLCHFCANPFSAVSLPLHVRGCKERKELLRGSLPLAGPPDVPPTPEWRREYNEWARDIALNQDLLTPCQLCGHGVLPQRLSTHLWRCVLNSGCSPADAGTPLCIAAPFSPYEQASVCAPLRALDEGEGPRASAARASHRPPFKLPSVLEAWARSDPGAQPRRETRGAETANPTRRGRAAKGRRSERETVPARPKACGVPPCLRFRFAAPPAEKPRKGARDADSLLFWQRKEASAYLKWFANATDKNFHVRDRAQHGAQPDREEN
ncbi:hypothetical protein BESB_020580 [Besnoitia besnoiti]|uniref:Uncharacterized protein n=1 Tax=Besnoitia besnoiti TaxID=94643 RepID=A0A2A9M921_BESBE|nr:hypothetical protein BESB_020580 [Besnoitia besnoiti]PFH32117.1 hypothetical protein BESB_020580 [Besnoitia besnoiti]